MKRAAVFFDRDNTLIANDGYLGDPNGVTLVEGAADAIARARQMGFAVVVFSNQSGVARGMFAEEAVHAVNHRMDEMLLDENAHAVIDRHEFCPFHPEATVERYRQDSDLRKPKPGMILQAERQLALDLSRSWVVGDAARDMDAGKAAGCRTILVKNPSLPSSPAALSIGSTTPDFEVTTIREAAEVIAQHPAAVPTEPAPVAASATDSTEVTEEVKEDEVSNASNTDSQTTSESFAAEAPAEHETPVASRNATSERAEEENDVPPVAPRGKSRQEILLGQILDEMRRQHERPPDDFSVSMLMAGVVQVIAFGCLFWAFIHRAEYGVPGISILLAVFLQGFTIALLLWGRQK